MPLFLIAYFAPESELSPISLFGNMLIPLGPWWLVRHGRHEEAKVALKAAAAPGHYDNRNLDAYIAYMRHVDQMERAEASQGSFKECFKGTNLRRTEIVC